MNLKRHRGSINRQLPHIHLPDTGVPLLPIPMEGNPRRIHCHIRTPGTLQHPPSIPTPQQRLLTLRIRPLDVASSSIRNIIEICVEAIAREEENIRPVSRASEAGRFYQGTIAVVAVEDGDGVIDGGDTVGGRDLLEHDRSVMGAVCVAAWSAAAEGVAVDFVGYVDGAGGVDEAARVDGATFAASKEFG